MASEPFLGDIRIFAFNFAPKNWAQCNGQLLSVNQNQALFSILGTTYGGNGSTTFALPNFQGRVPIHVGTGGGSSYSLGQLGGSASVTLAGNQVPAHTHIAQGSSATANVVSPGSSVLPGTAPTNATNCFTTDTGSLVPMAAGTLTTAGTGQAHENRQPSQVLTVCICLSGLYPSRS